MSHKLTQNFMSPSLACGLLGITGNNKGEMQPPRHGSNVGCSPTMCQIGVWHSRNQGQPRLDDGTPHVSALPPSLPLLLTLSISPSFSLSPSISPSLPLSLSLSPSLALTLWEARHCVTGHSAHRKAMWQTAEVCGDKPAQKQGHHHPPEWGRNSTSSRDWTDTSTPHPGWGLQKCSFLWAATLGVMCLVTVDN